MDLVCRCTAIASGPPLTPPLLEGEELIRYPGLIAIRTGFRFVLPED